MNIDDALKLNIDQLTQLWLDMHRGKGNVAAVLSSSATRRLLERTSKFPRFLYPLQRLSGVEFILSEHVGVQTLFTSLLEYQTHQENARPWLKLNFYHDLRDLKDVVLIEGERLIKEGLSETEADRLQTLFLESYLYDNGKFALVKRFHEDPSKFDYRDLLKDIPQFSISAEEK